MAAAVAGGQIDGRSGLKVCYVSYGKHRYHAIIVSVHEGGCDLLVQVRCYCCKVASPAPERATVIHCAAYDRSGQQPHSWHTY
jgi:hypothetical protein